MISVDWTVTWKGSNVSPGSFSLIDPRTSAFSSIQDFRDSLSFGMDRLVPPPALWMPNRSNFSSSRFSNPENTDQLPTAVRLAQCARALRYRTASAHVNIRLRNRILRRLKKTVITARDRLICPPVTRQDASSDTSGIYLLPARGDAVPSDTPCVSCSPVKDVLDDIRELLSEDDDE